jgi:hypothetical protein
MFLYIIILISKNSYRLKSTPGIVLITLCERYHQINEQNQDSLNQFDVEALLCIQESPSISAPTLEMIASLSSEISLILFRGIYKLFVIFFCIIAMFY